MLVDLFVGSMISVQQSNSPTDNLDECQQLQEGIRGMERLDLISQDRKPDSQLTFLKVSSTVSYMELLRK